MQITITGPRGGGSTTLAIEIGKMLRAKGMRVTFRSRTSECEKARRDALDHESPTDWAPSHVVIVDGVEPEDEHDVAHRGN
jgi:molybdopterin-guanine dinucleotide biosynthesis protein